MLGCDEKIVDLLDPPLHYQIKLESCEPDPFFSEEV
jgi:hypothetical protein